MILPFILLNFLFISCLSKENVIHPILKEIGEKNDGYSDFCVVGAGPAGVQLANHFESAGADYVVIERNSAPGSFYSKFPRHEQLSKLCLSVYFLSPFNFYKRENLRYFLD